MSVEEANGGMNGKVVLITGGTSGIGKAAAVELAGMGAEVVITGRNEERGREAVEEIKGRSGSGAASLLLADLSAQAGVRRLAEDFREGHDRLDVLVNNAGVVNRRRSETVDGIESTLATNHLAPFLLTNLLLDLLKESAPSRIVTTASEAERWGRLDLDDLQSRRRYGAFPVYGMTKLANIMFTIDLGRSWRGRASRRTASTRAP
ncbi:SDR family NAD(P)-dependent oxidoreductase [Rubrobacter marinus]|uniref:SDR family NAD(P)-dependent oxidoreductase n=1 Tax=Rubrobacter marinus TaxID=2653852 RepID=A0A6G8PZQ8_9ACTN|nr:SDR family NAD(P)-dependent oxidoreductase [Rubrobacter marinus]QIN79709.1 SDR family NAD(P)-dependent oxidoreductase [Rubrobacter marinus]